MRCYLFDLDGTLCDNTHRLHHITGEAKNWTAFYAEVGRDKPIPHGIRLLKDLAGSLTRNIVYITGRSEECRKDTEDWLNRQGVPTGPIYMRPVGDHRPDTEVKAELLAKAKAAGCEPVFMFEDRSRVVEAVRALGIPCAQVAEGAY